jgi:hypothetical protein
LAHFNFNTADVEPGDSFEALPKGWYSAQIIESEIKPNSKNTGEVMVLIWQIVEGEFENRRIFQYLNVSHDNPVAQKIGIQELGRVCEGVGVLEMTDSEELHFKPAAIRLGQQPGNKGDPINVIEKVAPLDGELPQQQPPARQQNTRQTTQRQPATNTRQSEQTQPAQTTRQPSTGATGGGKTGPWAGRR